MIWPYRWNRQQQRLGARGKITLRNDSGQRRRSRCCRSHLLLTGVRFAWTAKPFSLFRNHTFRTSIHTGAAFRSHRYATRRDQAEGFRGDRNRLRGCNSAGCNAAWFGSGVPEGIAKHTSWDQISLAFTSGSGRGICGVVSDYDGVGGFFEGNSLFEVCGSMEARGSGEVNSKLRFTISRESGGNSLQ